MSTFLEDFNQAEELYKEAWGLLKKPKEKKAANKKFEEASELFKKCEKQLGSVLNQLSNKDAIRVYQGLAKVYHEYADTEKDIDYYNSALKYYKELLNLIPNTTEKNQERSNIDNEIKKIGREKAYLLRKYPAKALAAQTKATAKVEPKEIKPAQASKDTSRTSAKRARDTESPLALTNSSPAKKPRTEPSPPPQSEGKEEKVVVAPVETVGSTPVAADSVPSAPAAMDTSEDAVSQQNLAQSSSPADISIVAAPTTPISQQSSSPIPNLESDSDDSNIEMDTLADSFAEPLPQVGILISESKSDFSIEFESELNPEGFSYRSLNLTGNKITFFELAPAHDQAKQQVSATFTEPTTEQKPLTEIALPPQDKKEDDEDTYSATDLKALDQQMKASIEKATDFSELPQLKF